MEKYTLTITALKDSPDSPTLKDILGEEYMEYYDGWGFSNETKEKDFFFYNVPKKLVDLVPARIKNYPYIKYCSNRN